MNEQLDYEEMSEIDKLRVQLITCNLLIREAEKERDRLQMEIGMLQAGQKEVN